MPVQKALLLGCCCVKIPPWPLSEVQEGLCSCMCAGATADVWVVPLAQVCSAQGYRPLPGPIWLDHKALAPGS